MRTKTLQARRIDTTMRVVTGGQDNLVDPGERRKSLKVAEAHVDGKAKTVTLRCVDGDAWRVLDFKLNDRVRVLA